MNIIETGKINHKYIYVMQVNANGSYLHKVGISVNPKQRVNEVSTGCPFPVKVVYQSDYVCKSAAHKEKMIHKILEQYHSNGEWYCCSLDTVLDAVKSLSEDFEFRDYIKKQVNRTTWTPNLERFTSMEMIAILNGRKITACKKFFIPHGIPWPPPHKWKNKLIAAIKDYVVKNNIINKTE